MAPLTATGAISRRRLARAAATGIFLLVVVALIVTAWFARSFDIFVSTLPYAMVGAAIVWQRPQARIGWVLLAFALLWSATFLGVEVAASEPDRDLVLAAAWLAEWTWFPALVSVFVVLPILFPTGSAPTRGWTAVLWFSVALSIVFVAITSIQSRFSPNESLVVPNPWAMLDLADAESLLVPVMLPLLILGPVSAVVRFRRSRGPERQQIRWFMYAAVACAAVFIANNAIDALTGGWGTTATEIAFVVALSLPPLGIWIAVTRYHLYEIDRLVSRTLSYGLLTAVLVGLYVLSVFVFGAVIPIQGDLPVAASTLLVAAVFNPLRRYLQDVVDRRFNRARYDVSRFAESFSHRLRVEDNLGGIGTELEEAVRFTMQPTSFSLWLRDPDAGVGGGGIES